MPPLKRVREEIFAQRVVKHNGNQSQAYKSMFPDKSIKSASVLSTKMMSRERVRERVAEIMAENKRLTLDGLLGRLGELTKSRNEGVSLRAVENGLDLHGVKENVQEVNNPVQLNFIINGVREVE